MLNYIFLALINEEVKYIIIHRDILQKGGSAADAGIAAMLCVGLVNCQSAGIGGGHFTIFYNRTARSVLSVNAREQAPGLADEEMFVGDPGASTRGKLLAHDQE